MPAKTQKHTYEYDANGNLIYEYMRGNGTGQAKNETLYTYDALNRLITAHDNYGNSTRTYTYDSLGNLTYETGDGSHNMDYTYNNLNQLVTQSDDGWKTYTASSYDNRGNLVLEEYHKNKKTVNTIGQYFYDETNKMVRGINAAGEESLYSYNGLGALVENTWKIAQNGYGYHGVNADTSDNESTNGQGNGNSNGNSAGNNGNGNVKKISTVIKQFVPDYTTETYQPLTEHEVNGLDYRYVYSDKARLSVVVQGIENGSASVLDENGELHAYYHCDYLGTTDYLTSAVSSKVISWTSYNEWGEITHNAVLNCGARELDLVKLYATHDYDAVLNQFYAKARFYDADNRRFTAVDPILDPAQYNLKAYANDPMQLVQYLYVKNNAVNYIDPLGLTSYNVLNQLADMHYRGKLTSEGVAFYIMRQTMGNPYLTMHQIAQVYLAAQMKKAGYSSVQLEHTFAVNNTQKRADVLGKRSGTYYIFEIKPYWMAAATNLRPKIEAQLDNYYWYLSCEYKNQSIKLWDVKNNRTKTTVGNILNKTMVKTDNFIMYMDIYDRGGGVFGYTVSYRKNNGPKTAYSKLKKAQTDYNSLPSNAITDPDIYLDAYSDYSMYRVNGKQKVYLSEDLKTYHNQTVNAMRDQLTRTAITATGFAAVSVSVVAITAVGGIVVADAFAVANAVGSASVVTAQIQGGTTVTASVIHNADVLAYQSIAADGSACVLRVVNTTTNAVKYLIAA